jgi:hypothetical protein
MLVDYTDESEVAQYLPKTVTTGTGKELPVFDADGKIIAANLPSVVPGDFIKQEEYHGDAEIFACLNVPMIIGDYEVRPPSLGVWSLLETFACPFVNQFGTGIDMIHCYRALYINEFREDCALDVYRWREQNAEDNFIIDDEETWTDFDVKVLTFVESITAAGFDISEPTNWWKIRMYFNLSFNGHSMIPPAGGGGKFIFGAESMASVISGVGRNINVPAKELLWNTPLILIGHIMAAEARNGGVKGVCRPKDKQDIRKQLILATAREYRGELHPWQIMEPLKRCLTPIQKTNEKLVKEFEILRAETAKKAGKLKNG